MSRPLLRLGTRQSPLALAQSRTVARALEAAHPGVEVELVPLLTKGDRIQGQLAPLGGKGLFTAELEEGLLGGGLDLAVHSLKDLPVEVAPGLVVVAFPPRADPRDALISDEATSIRDLAPGVPVLTGALRRQAQISKRRPDLPVESIRGSVGTRLDKWRGRPGAALILAAAGLERLEVSQAEAPAHPIPPEVMLPAPGQGILAVQVRLGSEAAELCQVLNDAATEVAARAERAVVTALGGSCTLPLAVWARREGTGSLRISAFLATPDGRLSCEAEATGPSAEAAAQACIDLLHERGAAEVLERIGGNGQR